MSDMIHLQTHAVHYAHCEYDRGYIVFNRRDNYKEVWRRTVDADGVQHPEMSPPDKKMLEASTQAAATFHSAESHWGHFKAWALLRIPEDTRAFRFSYPTLVAAATNNAYLWDVPRSQLVSVIRDIQRKHHSQHLAAINYVEVNDLYVFICGGRGLRIFAREGGALLYQLSTIELSSATWDVLPQTRGLASSVVHPQMLLQNYHSPSSMHREFMACMHFRFRATRLEIADNVCFQVMYLHQGMILLFLHLMVDSSSSLIFSAYLPDQMLSTIGTSPSPSIFNHFQATERSRTISQWVTEMANWPSLR